MRVLRVAVAVAVASVVLAGCGSDDSPEGGVAVEAGPWSFTDGSGEVVKADKTPERIIAHAGEAAALMSFGIKPVGIYADESVKTDPNLKDLDLTGIEILGEEWGKIDVEKAAGLRPDLIVADWWPAEKAHSGMEEGVEEKSKKLGELAPIVGVSQGKSIVDLAEGYEKLAESLGADVDRRADRREQAAVRGLRRAVQGGGRGQARADRRRDVAGRRPVVRRQPRVRARAARLPDAGGSTSSTRPSPTPVSRTGRTSAGRTPTSTSPT